MKPAQKGSQKSAWSTIATSKKFKGFTDAERVAMKECIQVLKTGEEDGESAVLAKIAEMSEPDRSMGMRLHSIVKSSAPALSPRLWCGMPAHAKEGKNVCFFQPAQEFKTKYATLGFSDKADLDEGAMWPTAFALKGFAAAEKSKVAALVE